jgi:hypothetical protein
LTENAAKKNIILCTILIQGARAYYIRVQTHPQMSNALGRLYMMPSF